MLARVWSVRVLRNESFLNLHDLRTKSNIRDLGIAIEAMDFITDVTE